MTAIAINFQDFIQVQNNQAVTTSEFVAKAFGKLHKNVLQKIEELLTQVPDSFGKLNFKPTENSRKNNLGFTVKDKAYELTKDGFMLLVMGFTGKAAMQIKIAYIQAFNAMAETLKKQSSVSGRDLGDILGECFAADAERRAQSKEVAVPKKRRPKPLERPQKGFMLLMPDESLNPVIPRGSKLWVDTAKTNIIDGKIYFIEDDNGWWVRRLFRMPYNCVAVAGWYNPEFDFETDLGSIRIIGRVTSWKAIA